MRDRRPFKDHDIEDLLELEPRAHDDERLRAVVLAELGKRDMTPRESALQRRLLQGDRSVARQASRRQSTETKAAITPPRRPTPSQPRRAVREPAARQPAPREPAVVVPSSKSGGRTDVEARYAALRATCTEEAEVMARWGFTPALPVAMQDRLLSAWRSAITDQPDEFGRTLRQLDGDIERIRDLRSSR